MRAQQSGLSIIGRCYRLLASCSITEKFINLTHGGRISRLWRHIPSGYAWLWVAEPPKWFYDPVVLGLREIALANSPIAGARADLQFRPAAYFGADRVEQAGRVQLWLETDYVLPVDLI